MTISERGDIEKDFTFDQIVQDLTTIKNQLTSLGLFEAFKKQLAKDFEQSSFAVEVIASLEPDYAHIHRKLVLELERSQKNNMMKLLNRIDISEAQLKKYVNKQKEESRLSVMAELIIKRVLQKVVIRQFYKSSEQRE